MHLALLLFAFLGSLVALPARADDYRWLQVVGPKGSIQQAIDRARPGGFVFVLPGTYRESAERHERPRDRQGAST